MKKKTSAKKTSLKATSKKGSGQPSKAASGAPSRLDNIKRTSKKLVDQMLVKVSPQLQDQIDKLIKTLESSKRGPLNDLSLMAGKILVRAQEVSRSLRQQKTTPKKRKPRE